VRGPAARGSLEIVASGIRTPAWRPRLAAFCAKVLASTGRQLGDVSILLCGDERIAELNRRYRGIHRPTDVLSFSRGSPRGSPRGKGAELSGDIAISLESLARNAAAYGVSRNEELKRLAIHGLLHLAGLDHGRGKGSAMLRLQARIAEEMEGERIIR
jgi:probable rRNA maturation factor